MLPEKNIGMSCTQADRHAGHGKQLGFESQCKAWFRFNNEYILGFIAALGLQEELVASNRMHCTGLEGLCILLHMAGLSKLFQTVQTRASLDKVWQSLAS